MCEKVGKLRCTGCSVMHYCSKTCQKRDWPVHKIVCKTYKEFVSTSPGPNHYSAILFHPHEEQPRFIWLHLENDQLEPTTQQLMDLGFLAEKVAETEWPELSCSLLLGHRHIEPHHILVSQPAVADMCPCCTSYENPNRSLTKVDQELGDFFRGAVLALGTNCKDDVVRTPEKLNLTPMDFRHVIDMLRIKYSTHEETMRSIVHSKKPDLIRAVRLNCIADTHYLRRPTLEAIRELPDILEMDTHISTPVAEKIGIPLIVRQVPPALAWRGPSNPSRMLNHTATMLNPPMQPATTGSLIVARKDGKPLLPVHIHALITYTATKLKKSVHRPNACIFAVDLDASLIQHVDKEDFEKWYEGEWQGLLPGDEKVISPYVIGHGYEGPCEDLKRGVVAVW